MEMLLFAGSAINAVGNIVSGRQQSAAFQAAAAANRYNAAVMRQRSDTVLSATNQREEQQRRVNRILEGKRIASIGESGFDYSGSNLDVETQNAALAELDALNIRYEGTLESRGLLAQANLEEAEAASNLRSARYARSASYLGAAGSLLSGVGRYNKYSKMPGTD